MKKCLILLGLVVQTAATARGQNTDCVECRTVLAGGVFNTININQTQSSKDAFTAWECSTNFSTHDEAMNAGVSVGVPIYDVPVTVGGTFSNSKRDEWKSAHCSNTTKNAQSFSNLVVAMREAAPSILSAWTRCIELTCGSARTALGCSLSPKLGGAIFRANWIRSAGDATPPRIQFFKAYDAACSPAVKVNQVLSESGFALNCQVPINKEAVLILQTSRGTCTPTAAGVVSAETISGRVILDSPKNYKAEKITFASDAVIVTNGNRLTLDAAEISFQGAPKIVSFDPVGVSGRSANTVLIKAKRLTGTSLIIENIGDNGPNGSAGAAGGKGPHGAQGTQRDYNVFKGCIGGSDGTPGGQGGDGSDGGSGGSGGSGGTVIFDVETGLREGALQRLVIKTDGGQGGAGGEAGAPGAGGDGGEGAPGRANCGGTGPGAGGPPGRPGRGGSGGAHGNPGQVVDYRL